MFITHLFLIIKSYPKTAAKTLCVTNAEGLPLRMINVTDQPQTIYKNTFAAMAETIPDRNIINKFVCFYDHLTQGRYGHHLAKGDSEQTWYLTFQDTSNGLVIQTYRMVRYVYYTFIFDHKIIS
jgi:hypothetical protein